MIVCITREKLSENVNSYWFPWATWHPLPFQKKVSMPYIFIPVLLYILHFTYLCNNISSMLKNFILKRAAHEIFLIAFFKKGYLDYSQHCAPHAMQFRKTPILIIMKNVKIIRIRMLWILNFLNRSQYIFKGTQYKCVLIKLIFDSQKMKIQSSYLDFVVIHLINKIVCYTICLSLLFQTSKWGVSNRAKLGPEQGSKQ